MASKKVRKPPVSGEIMSWEEIEILISVPETRDMIKAITAKAPQDNVMRVTVVGPDKEGQIAGMMLLATFDAEHKNDDGETIGKLSIAADSADPAAVLGNAEARVAESNLYKHLQKEVVPKIAWDAIVTSHFPVIAQKLERYSSSAASIFRTIPKRQVSTGTLGVYFDKVTGKNVLIYNPHFIVCAVIAEYLINRRSYSDLRGAFCYFMLYVIIHEMAHVIFGHTLDRGQMPNIPHVVMNIAADSFINLGIPRLLDDTDIVRKKTFPSVGIQSEISFKGAVKKDIVGASMSVICKKVVEIFDEETDAVVVPGNASGSVPIVYHPDHPELGAVLHIGLPTQFLSSLYGGRSVNWVRTVHKLISTFLAKPEPLKPKPTIPPTFKVGDLVKVKNGKHVGRVRSIDDQGNVVVDVLSPAEIEALKAAAREEINKKLAQGQAARSGQ